MRGFYDGMILSTMPPVAPPSAARKIDVASAGSTW
jgi:hypothetical protein